MYIIGSLAAITAYWYTYFYFRGFLKKERADTLYNKGSPLAQRRQLDPNTSCDASTE